MNKWESDWRWDHNGFGEQMMLLSWKDIEELENIEQVAICYKLQKIQVGFLDMKIKMSGMKNMLAMANCR